MLTRRLCCCGSGPPPPHPCGSPSCTIAATTVTFSWTVNAEVGCTSAGCTAGSSGSVTLTWGGASFTSATPIVLCTAAGACTPGSGTASLFCSGGKWQAGISGFTCGTSGVVPSSYSCSPLSIVWNFPNPFPIVGCNLFLSQIAISP